MRARDLGFRNLVGEIDSETVMRMIESRNSCAPHVETSIGAIREVVIQDWRLEIMHTYGEGNHCAGWIIWLGLSKPLGSDYFTQPSIGIGALLHGDLVRAYVPCLCILLNLPLYSFPYFSPGK